MSHGLVRGQAVNSSQRYTPEAAPPHFKARAKSKREPNVNAAMLGAGSIAISCGCEKAIVAAG
jgi:hypothetical protein